MARSRSVLLAAALSAIGLTSRPATGCEGTTERIVGYSLNEDEYLAEERSLSGAEPARYVTRRLTTDEVVDFVTCPGSGPCTATEALGVRACSFRPVPRLTLEKISLEPEADHPSDSQVWLNGTKGPMPLLRVRGEGSIGLRSGVQTGSSVVLFLKQTQEDDGCPRSHERAVLLNEPGTKLPEIDLTTAPEPATEARVPAPPTSEPIGPLAQAAQVAAATHLDTLAACWAQEALWMMQVQRARAARARARELPEPIIEISDVKVIVGPPSAP